MGEEARRFELHPALAADCTLVGDLPLCRVLLMRDCNYPWLILVPRRDGLRELHELAEPDLAQFWRESTLVSRALQQYFRADKLNVAALGNVVEQLHVHHIVRYHSDCAWPRPVWGVVPARPYAETQLDELCATLRSLFGIDQGLSA